jgi:hypothetical protein
MNFYLSVYRCMLACRVVVYISESNFPSQLLDFSFYFLRISISWKFRIERKPKEYGTLPLEK